MQFVDSVFQLRETLKGWRSAGLTIAFVPTMGNLHAGHLKLVEEARENADKVVVSIFVNPMQFGVGEDFETYPRTELEDNQKLRQTGADLLFQPTVTEVYASDAKTVVTVSGLSDMHCGLSRPGHFSGVATVVCKLFNMVQPDIALFGTKDFQQLAVIKTMVRDLNIPVGVIGVETVREASGLAMSSRNGYLTNEEKQIAPSLYQALCQAKAAVQMTDQPYSSIEQAAMTALTEAGFQPVYFSICRAEDLSKATPTDNNLVILAAAKLGKTRLIDNLAFSLN
ncbi:MAG: pantoate--beta-alanine ligase [Methylococcaceae bacterium]|nr:pantoate--beta-alanine ligase [Methylococcaceae bacterium]